MDFGKVPDEQLNHIDFSLPAEPVGNGLVLPGARAAKPQVRLGVPEGYERNRLYGAVCEAFQLCGTECYAL